MAERKNAGGELCGSIFDPTGNITALVESDVAVERQPAVAAALMRRHPEVEQVGFVRLAEGGARVQAELRMAGGEFCGNASMSAAALWCIRQGQTVDAAAPCAVLLRVSGAAEPVEVRLREEAADTYAASVRMPRALDITEREFVLETCRDRLPVVRMEGITHVLIEERSVFFALREDETAAARAVKSWCARLGADGLGLMFLEGGQSERRLTPLVYVPVGDTLFWESSCASGSAAVGMTLAARAGARAALTLAEPGGSLRVESEPAGGETWLCGKTRLLSTWRAES
ncbi:MAG: hypothetical protein IJ594_05665 [Oscillospiraceae bacterium]|nr:hypothetical protein [Oscillospiraceae bacterium]